MDLTALALVAIGTLTQAHPLPMPEASEYAVAMANAVGNAPLATLDPERTVLLLTALGYEESGFQRTVNRCRREGSERLNVRGRAGEVGTWQLIPGPNWEGHTARKICNDTALQAQLALDVLHRAELSRQRPSGEGPFITFFVRAYTSGPALLDTPSARERIATYRRLIGVFNRQRTDGVAWTGTL